MLWRGVEVVQQRSPVGWEGDGGRRQVLEMVFALAELWSPTLGSQDGFRDVLGSQWWRIGLKTSLIVSRGFQGNS